MPRAIASLSVAEAARVEGVLFDLDDTFLDHGLLTETAFRALNDLKRARWLAIAVTGRAARWAEAVGRTWPIDALVAENGAVAFLREGARLRRSDRLSPIARAERWKELLSVTDRLQREFPDLVLTSDEGLRLSDFTFDIGEFNRMPPERIAQVRRRAEDMGARVSVSSIHLHITLDGDDKASGAVHLLTGHFERDPGALLHQFAFIGDSGNDAPCFAAFPLSIGVANYRAGPSLPPRFVTTAPMGAGFAEAVAVLLARASTSPSGV